MVPTAEAYLLQIQKYEVPPAGATPGPRADEASPAPTPEASPTPSTPNTPSTPVRAPGSIQGSVRHVTPQGTPVGVGREANLVSKKC